MRLSRRARVSREGQVELTELGQLMHPSKNANPSQRQVEPVPEICTGR